MRDLAFVALLALFVCALVFTPPTQAGVTVTDPIYHPGHVEIELTTDQRAGVRTTSAAGAGVWLEWRPGSRSTSLTVQPMGTGNPGQLVWHGTEAGKDRLTIRVAWPGPCPCAVEVTAGEAVVRTWPGVTP